MELLNDRELASLIFLGAALAGALLLIVLNTEMRSSFVSLVRAVMQPKLLAIWLMYTAVVFVVMLGVFWIGLDYEGAIKDAVVWAVITGLPVIGRFGAVSKSPGMFREIIFEAVALTAFVEFFVNLYVFQLWVELILQPVVFVLLLLAEVVPGNDENGAKAKRIASRFLTFVGLAALSFATIRLVVELNQLDVRTTVLSFVQPVILTTIVVGLTYVVSLISSYEQVFIRMGGARIDTRSTLSGKLALIAGLHLNVYKVSGFRGNLPRRLGACGSFGEARKLVRMYRNGSSDAS